MILDYSTKPKANLEDEDVTSSPVTEAKFSIKGLMRDTILGFKWVLVLFYIGLIYVQSLYAVKFVVELYDVTVHFMSFTENDMLLSVLTIIDLVMIANLVKTIVTGSYYSFVEKVDDPMEKISSGYLKVKMGMSLVGISSIHLLETFINSKELSDRDIIIRCSIHMIFLVGTIGLGIVEFLHEKSKTYAPKGEH